MINETQDYADRVVAVRGLQIFTRRRHGNAAPPLVLINGLGGSLTSWGPLLERLPDRDVIMIDTPGSGRSQTPRFPIRVNAIADIIAEATGALGADEVDVLGFSLGGTIAQEFAKRHPDLIRKLILVATMYGIGARSVPVRAHRMLLSTRRYRDRTTMEHQMPLLAGGRSARDPEALAKLLAAREGCPPSIRGYYYQQLSLIAWTSWPWLKKLRCPTLVLHGSADPVVPKVNARIMAARIPNTELGIIDGGGHLVLFDESEKTAPIIDAFLNG